jgi:hypothetical protein
LSREGGREEGRKEARKKGKEERKGGLKEKLYSYWLVYV